jgi:YidC/Oxa1 family membrane protein insertase
MLALLLGYKLLMARLYKEHPSWFEAVATENTSVAPATQPTAVASTGPTTGPTTGSAIATTVPSVTAPAVATGFQPVDAPKPLMAVLGTGSNYQMVLTVDPKGAGLQSVVLSKFYETAAHEHLYTFEQPLDGFESITRPMATRTVTINGTDVDLSNTTWQQTADTIDSATYTTIIRDGIAPALELSKTFKLLPAGDEKAKDGSGYDVVMNQSFRNLTGKPMKVAVTFNGPTPPESESKRSEDRRYVTGYDKGFTKDDEIDTGSASVSDFAKGKPAKDLITSDPRPTLWVGACSSYFESIYRPDYAGKPGSPAVKLAEASVVGIDPGNNPQPEDAATYPTQLAISTNDFTLAPGATDKLDAHVFFGPKQRELLKNDYYSAFPMMYHNTLVYTSGPCGYITFTWLINTLYFLLWCFHKVFFNDWGIAIICLVALVRTLLHPITKRSQINMVEMSKKGPELERLKKKFGDDKEALLKAQAELMNPMGMVFGCLPMFLQTPIWIALWSALQSTFELRQAGFLRFGHVHLTWISDLSQPDALFKFHKVALPLIFFHPEISSINILPLLLAVVFFVQQAMQPVPPNMTPEQEQQRKMMKWMSLLFPVMLYLGPSGLNLYILTSTSIGIIESKIIRDHIKQRDEAEKAGRIIVDAAPTRGSKKRRDDDDFGSSKKTGKNPQKPVGGLARWFADLQAKADQLKREAERRGNK